MQGYAEQLLDSCIGLKEKYAMLNPVVRNESLRNKFSGKRQRGLTIIRNILFLSCAIDIANICLESGQHAASINQFILFLADKKIINQLRETFADREIQQVSSNEIDIPTEILKAHHDKRKKMYLSTFDNNLSELNSLWSSFSQSGIPDSFKTIRDKIAAHVELRFDDGKYKQFDANKLDISWDNLDTAINTIQQLVELINNIVRRAGFAWDDLDEQLEKASLGFWEQPNTGS